MPGLLCKDGGRGSRWGQSDYLTAIIGPGESEGAHGGCLPGAGGGDRKLQPSPGGAHLADQCRLPSIECSAVRRHLQQGQIHRRLLDRRTAVTSRRRDETGLGIEDPLRGVEGGAGDGVDRRPVNPPQRLRFLDVVRCGEGNGPVMEDLIDQKVHQRRGVFSRHVNGADLPLCFGPDMPHLPGRSARLHNAQDVISRPGHPAGVGDRSGLRGRCQCRPHHRRDSLRAA